MSSEPILRNSQFRAKRQWQPAGKGLESFAPKQRRIKIDTYIFDIFLFLGKIWCPGAESNHRHEDFQSTALPLSYPGTGARNDKASLAEVAVF